MARRRTRRRSYRREESLEEMGAKLFVILMIGGMGWVYFNWETVVENGPIVLGVIVLLAGLVIFLLRRFKGRKSTWTLDDEKTLAMLKGLTPSEFEQEISKMFSRLGYNTRVTGGANDGGVDVIATKENKRYYIQCKKFITREVTPHDVRDFLGAVANANEPADKGFFVTTGNFTLMAEKTAEGNPRIELVDGKRLLEYYKMSFNGVAPTLAASTETVEESKPCPRCGGMLVERTANKGSRKGQNFIGCSNFPKCRYVE